jgi:hypothetical protein
MICVQMRHECWTSQTTLSCSPWQSVCHYWTATDVTHSCMPGCETILAVTASWLISVCGFCLCDIRSWKPHVWWFLEMKKLLNLLKRCWVERAGPIPWPGRSSDFTPVDIFWSNVTEHIYIPPFCILMEGHTEIEQVLRPAVFLDCTQHKVVILFRFGVMNRCHLQGSRCPSRTCLDSRQPAHTGCLLEELTVTELI